MFKKQIFSVFSLLILGLTSIENFSLATPLPNFLKQEFKSNIFQDVEYPSATFKAGTKSLLTPKIIKAGGVFSYKRISAGEGVLVINQKTGIIDQGISDPGQYYVVYKTNEKKTAIVITVF